MRRTLKRPLSLPVKNAVPHEAYEQIKFATWLSKQGIKFTSSANGGYRNAQEGAKFKRMGVSSGFPDVEIPLPASPYHGLYIEIKRVSGGKVSEQQQEWLDYLNSKGYYAAVAKGFEEAKKIVVWYLSLIPKAA